MVVESLGVPDESVDEPPEALPVELSFFECFLVVLVVVEDEPLMSSCVEPVELAPVEGDEGAVESEVPEPAELPVPAAPLPVVLGLEPLRSSEPADDPVEPELEPPIAPEEVMSRLFTLRASPEPE